VSSIIGEFGAHDLRTDGLETALQDETFVSRLKEAYAEEADWDADPTQIFYWAVLSLTIGPEGAVRRARSDGRTAWREVASIARREALSSVPDIDDMLGTLEDYQKDEDPESDLESFASGLGATSQCARCGATMVDSDEFADAAVRYYKLRGRNAEQMRERLSDAAESLAVEKGSFDYPSFCSYCAHMMSKDD
jgi:hypothetical protein